MSIAGWSDDESVGCLLDLGASVDEQDSRGQTALMYAVNHDRRENIARLLAYKANVYLRDASGNSAVTLAQSYLATNATTPFTHDEKTHDWSEIVRMLERVNTTRIEGRRRIRK